MKIDTLIQKSNNSSASVDMNHIADGNGKANESVNVNFSVENNGFHHPTESEGLSFSTLIISNPSIHEEDNQDSNFHVSSLKDIKESDTTQKFSAQPVPMNEDRSMLPDEATRNAVMNNIAHNIKAKSEPIRSRRMNSWLSRLIERRGEDYITSGKLSTEEVSRNAEQIIDDIAEGRIDYTKYGKHMINPVILEPLISFCKNKIAIRKAEHFSSTYVYQDYTNMENISSDAERIARLSCIDNNMLPNMAQAISIEAQDIAFYTAIYNKLLYVQQTKNATALFYAATELKSCRKMIKKRY